MLTETRCRYCETQKLKLRAPHIYPVAVAHTPVVYDDSMDSVGCARFSDVLRLSEMETSLIDNLTALGVNWNQLKVSCNFSIESNQN